MIDVKSESKKNVSIINSFLKLYDLINFVMLFFFFLAEREDYRYSGSENEEDEEHNNAGEQHPSIVQAPGDNTLRRNFQQIQEGRTLTPHGKDKHGKEREEIPEPGPPARPPIIPSRLIGILRI